MIADVYIQAAASCGVTCLRDSYTTTPFKVANITEDKKASRLQLMLMSSSPGILDGDRYQFKIVIGENASLQLHTQSYQRLFNMKDTAAQSLEVQLKSGSSFCYLPHPVVPHANAVFRSVNRFHLEENCCLVFGEILTCGRKLNGEVFLFSKYHSTTEIYLLQKLVVKENLLIEPAFIDVDAIGQMEGFTHQASLLYLHPTARVKEVSESVELFLSAIPGIMYGISVLSANGLIIRILGHKAEQLHSCLLEIGLRLPQGV